MTGGGAFSLEGRTVVVSGAGRGLGLGLTRELATVGARVVAVDRPEALERAELTHGVLGVPADVRRREDVDAAVAAALASTGRLDVMVNFADLHYEEMSWRVPDEEWEAVLATRLGGTFRFTRACVPHFRERRGGRIVNVTSATGLSGTPGHAPAAAAHAGVVGLTKAAAKELAAFGVTVNAIAPNAEAGMFESMPADELTSVAGRVPLGRFGHPAEIAAAIRFLASDEAAYVTGAVLAVDGGLSM